MWSCCGSSDRRSCSTEAHKHIYFRSLSLKDFAVLNAAPPTPLGSYSQPTGPMLISLLPVVSIPWLVGGSLHSLPLSSHGILPCVFVSLCVSSTRKPVIGFSGFRVDLNPLRWRTGKPGVFQSMGSQRVKDREAWCAAVHGVTESDTTEWLNNNN